VKLLLQRLLVWTLSFQLVFQGLIAEAVAQSITPDAAAAAANQATVTTAPSGTPMLNIVAPNGAGVSHNQFTDFNVTSSGLILNNATGMATTQLGGVINANPNFAGTSARLILNEVTSANLSALNGATEIGGAKADYILANPGGITCNGCGFINMSRATLTTGAPVMSGGDVTGLSVNDGTVAIEGLGLDATTTDKFDIVTRAAAINAQVNATDLGVYTGRQDFDYANRTTVAKAHDGSAKPTFSIDSSALGGMYAGRIALVGTEAGVGVRFAADMGATAGDMTITADGQLVMNANATATGNLSATSTSSSVDVGKSIYAGGTAQANAGTAINMAANASLGAAGNVTTTSATVTAGAGGKVVAGMDAHGALTTAGTLKMTATTSITTGDGFLGGGADVQLIAPIIDLSRATDDASESVRSRGTLTATTQNLTATNGRIAADGALTVTNAAGLSVGAGAINSATSVTMAAASVSTAATVTSDGTLSVNATAGDVSNSGTLSAATTLAVSATGTVTNSGTMKSQTGTTVTATNVSTDAGSLITSAADTTVTASSTLTNAGDIYSPQSLTVTAPTINNTGTLAAGGDFIVNTAALTNTAGVLHAGNNFTLSGIGQANATLFDNASGVVETINGDITINADIIKNRKSVFTASSTLVFEGNTVSQPIIASGCSQYHQGGGCFVYNLYSINLRNSYIPSYLWRVYTTTIRGLVYFFRYYTGRVQADSTASLISSGKDIALTAATVDNDKSTISASGDIGITTTTLNNQAVGVYNEYYLSTLTAAWWLDTQTPVYSGDALIQAGGNLTVSASGGVRSATEQVYSAPGARAASVTSSALTATPTTSGMINTAQYADLIPARDLLFVTSQAPKPTFLFETRAVFVDQSLFLGSDYFLGQFGSFDPEAIPTRLGDAYFETQLIRQAVLQETGLNWLDADVHDDRLQMKALMDGGIQAARDLNLSFGISLSAAQAAALTSDIIWYEEEYYQGRTVLVPKLYLASARRGKFDPKGAVLAGENVTIDAASITNADGIITAERDVTLTASGDITSSSAEISAGKDIALTSTAGDVKINTQVDTHKTVTNVASVVHGRSTVAAGGNLTITANKDVSVLGANVAAGGDATLTAGGDVTVGAVQVRNEQHWDLASKTSTTNIGSTATAGGNFTISAGKDARIKGSTVAAGNDLTVQAVGDATVESTADTYDYSLQATSGGGLFGGKSSISIEDHRVTQNTSKLSAGGDVTIGSLAGDMSVVSSEVTAGDDITLNTPNGTLYLGARKNLVDIRIQKSSSGLMTMSSLDKGDINETVVPTLLTANGNLAIVTGNGVIVDYKDTGNLDQSIDQLSQAPGLAWMNDLRTRNDVAWNAVREVHQSWDYQSEGLSPTGALIVSLAVAVATSGAGAEWAVANMGAVEGSSLAMAADAGFSTLVSQASISLINNGGDLGAVLKDLGSSASLKSLATSMITAGLVSSALPDLATAAAGKEALFVDKLKFGIAKASISAGVDTVIQGGPLDENLKNGLINAAVTVVGEVAANEIGTAAADALKDPTNNVAAVKVRQLIAHAALGCGMGAAAGGSCRAGATGAVVGEVTSWGYEAMTSDELATDILTLSGKINSPEEASTLAKEMYVNWKLRGVGISRLTGALAATVGGASADGVSAAANTAGNAAENNALISGSAAVIALIATASAAWTAYDAYNAYEEEGAEVALKVLAVDGAITILGGGAVKITYKVGGKIISKADDAWAAWNALDSGVGKTIASKLSNIFGGANAPLGSALQKASSASFKAADDIGSWIPKNKHILGGGSQSKAKFNTDDIGEIRNIVQNILRSPDVKFLPNPNIPGSFRAIGNVGKPIGINGQKSVRVIVGSDGKVINAFPVFTK